MTNITEKPPTLWDDTTKLREIMEQHRREQYHADEYRRFVLGEWYSEYPDKPTDTVGYAEIWDQLRDTLRNTKMPNVIMAVAPTHNPTVSDILVGLTSVQPMPCTRRFTTVKDRPIGLVDISDLIA